MRPYLQALWLGILALPLSHCGYTLQTSKSPLLDREGIKNVYIEPLLNNTFTAGVENLVYNSLIREISAGRRVRIVKRKEDADAILRGTVDGAESRINALSTASFLPPSPLGGEVEVFSKITIATEYMASLTCTFNIVRVHPKPGQPESIWGGSFSRSRPFSASNRLGVSGTTSALINDSEFDRALSDMSHSMMADVHESMLAMF